MKPKAFLVDIDGVLRTEGVVMPGAVEAARFLKESRIPHLFISNGTRSSKESVARKLNSIGLEISEKEIFTAPVATADYVKSLKPDASIFLIAEGDTQRDFEKAGIKVTKEEEPVDFVVVGYDRNLTYDTLSKAFRLIRNGAGLIAMNVDKTFEREDGMFPAPGLYVKGLEYCTGKEALVIGKPNRTLFEMALRELGSRPDETAMVGDMLDVDIIGAKNSGLMAIMVKTGGYEEDSVRKSDIKPDIVLDSIKDLPGWIGD
jgi:HAD superfamily hydrolase (TIGR01458 family)